MDGGPTNATSCRLRESHICKAQFCSMFKGFGLCFQGACCLACRDVAKLAFAHVGVKATETFIACGKRRRGRSFLL